MTNVVNLGDKACNGMMNTPEDSLKSAINDIGKCGALEHGKKVMIIALDDSDGDYNTSFYQAGMKMPECLALCEVLKIRFLQEMRYIPDE